MRAPVKSSCCPVISLGILALLQPNANADTPQPPRAEIQQAQVSAAAFSPDGKFLAASAEGGIMLRELPSGKETRRIPVTSRMSGVCFSPDGTLLVAANDLDIHLWRVGSGEQLHCWRLEDKNEMHALAFSSGGSAVTVIYNRGKIRTWSVADGKEIPSPWTFERRQVLPTVTVSPDGAMLATTVGFKEIRLAPSAGRELKVPAPPTGSNCSLPSLAFSGDSKILAAAGSSVVVWESATGKELARFATGYYRAPYTLALSPDGATLASPGTEGFPWERTAGYAVIDEAGFFVRIRDVSTGRELRRLALPSIKYNSGDPVWGLKFAPDGRTLLGLRNDTIYLWDVSR